MLQNKKLYYPKPSEETCRKLSIACKGRISPMKGKEFSKEHKELNLQKNKKKKQKQPNSKKVKFLGTKG